MGIYVFLRAYISEVPVVERLPVTIDASSDEEAVEKTAKFGPGELFKKIPREKTLEKKKKNGLFKK